MNVTEEKRKVRIDRKRDIRPTIPISLYDTISRISYVTKTPIKDVGVSLCKKALYTTETIEKLSPFIKRDYWANNHILYTGDIYNDTFRFKKGLNKRRITMRFMQKDHEKLARLSYSLDMTISSATGTLLYYAIKNTNIVNAYISNKVRRSLDSQQMKQLKEIHKYINKNSPYTEEVPFSAFIMLLVEEVKETALNVSDALKNWIDDNRNEN